LLTPPSPPGRAGAEPWRPVPRLVAGRAGTVPLVLLCQGSGAAALAHARQMRPLDQPLAS